MAWSEPCMYCNMPNLCNVCHNWVKCLLQPVAQSVKWSASKSAVVISMGSNPARTILLILV